MAQHSDLVIIGSGRHGRNVLDIALDLQRPVAGFLDDTKPVGTKVNGVVVLGGIDTWSELNRQTDCEFIVAIGWNSARTRISRSIESGGGRLCSLIHPETVVSGFATIGSGVLISSYCRVLANASVADYCLLEGHTTIGADSALGEGSSCGIGVIVTGGATVGTGTFLGSGAVIAGPARVGNESMVGANSVVLSDIGDRVIAAGAPAIVKQRLRGPPPSP